MNYKVPTMMRKTANPSPGTLQGTSTAKSPPLDEKKLPQRGRSRRSRNSINSAWNRKNRENSNGTNDDNTDTTEEPFIVLFLKVGITLFLFSFVSYFLFVQNQWARNPNFGADSSRVHASRNRHFSRTHTKNDESTRDAPTTLRKPNKKKVHQIPLFDAFDIASKYGLYESQEKSITTNNNNSTNSDDTRTSSSMEEITATQTTPSLFEKKAAQIRSQFANLVGGADQAKDTLKRSLIAFGPRQTGKESLQIPPQTNMYLARRLRTLLSDVKNENDPILSVAVLGSSAAAGSGNYFEQSYSFVLEKIMAPLFESLGIEFQVKNLAIKHTAEFPFVWCLGHYLGNSTPFPDVIIWDYGWTSTAESLEAFLRNVVGKARDNDQQPPLLIFRDTQHPNNNDQRDSLIQIYVDHNIILDPLLLHVEQAAAPFLNMLDKDLPPGFQSWTTSFGGPQGAPGKEHVHLTVRQHEMVAWLVSMHVLSALEMAVVDQANANIDFSLTTAGEQPGNSAELLPPPFVIKPSTRQRWFLDHEQEEEMIEKAPPAWLPLLVGEAENRQEEFLSGDGTAQVDFDGGLFHYPRGLQCHTSYITHNAEDDLDELIVSGSVAKGPLNFHQTKAQLLEDLLLPKTMKDGWVEDLDKNTKRKIMLTKQFNYLGFEEMIKKANWGLPNSGDLQFFIPLSESAKRKALAALHKTGLMPAPDFIETVLICEADLPKNRAPGSEDSNFQGDECRLHKDAYIHIGGEGGELAFQETIPSGVSSNCVFISVPDSSILTFNDELMGQKDSKNLNEMNTDHVEVGLPLTVRVRADRGGLRARCSVAHVLWQESGDN